jgi:hypothetical protein
VQVISQTVDISDRLGPFMEGLDVPAVVLLTSQRLVASAAAAVSGQGASSSSSGGGGGLRLAAEPPKRSIEEARLSVGMALAHVAQRMGHAHLSRRGVFGFGAQQVRLKECCVAMQDPVLACKFHLERLSSILACLSEMVLRRCMLIVREAKVVLVHAHAMQLLPLACGVCRCTSCRMS